MSESGVCYTDCMAQLMQLIDNFWYGLKSGQVLNLGWWSYALLALLVALEGPMATMLGAASASGGFMRLPLVYAAAVTGNLIADMLWYLLGYACKIQWLVRYGRWLGVRRRDLDQVQQGLQDHSPKVLLIAKLTNLLVIPTLIGTGLARVRWVRWFPAILIGTIISTGVLTLVGYYSTEAAKRVGQGLECLTFASPITFILVTLWLIRRRLKQRGESEDFKEQND